MPFFIDLRTVLAHTKYDFVEDNFHSSMFVFVFNCKTQLLVLITDPNTINLASF